MAEEDPSRPTGALHRLARWARTLRRGQSVTVRPSGHTLDDAAVEQVLRHLGSEGDAARRLEDAAELKTRRIKTLSALTSGLALDYIERLGRPISSLTPESGVEIVTHAYCAHLSVEEDPSSFGAVDVPVLGTLPPLKHGRPPQDILSRVVKASRRGFPVIRAVTAPVWDGYILLLTSRVHRATPDPAAFLPLEVVDGLARFGWVLRQVDIHYDLAPELNR